MQPRPSELQRIPFGTIDESIQILDTEAAPWSIQVEARVRGALDEDRLRAAILAAVGRHPLAHARRAPAHAGTRNWAWEIDPELDLDPLRVVDCPDDDALDRARGALYGMSVPLTESPPLRVRLARHPAGDVVMLNVNHTAMDGFGSLRVLRSIACAYAGEPEPIPEVDLSTSRGLEGRLAAASATGGRRETLSMVGDKLRDLLGAPARLQGVGGNARPGYGFRHVRLSPAQTSALLSAPRGPATINDVLLATLALTIAGWNEEHGVAPRRLGTLVPVNLWPRDLGEGAVGNYWVPVRVSVRPRDLRSSSAALRAVTHQTRHIKEHGSAAHLIGMLGRSRSLPIWAKRALPVALWLTGNRLIDTTMLSNLGAITDPPSFGRETETLELWFSPPARMPLGLALGAVTTMGRLHLTFRYRHALFGPAACARFANRYLAALGSVLSYPPGWFEARKLRQLVT
ncbi:MAG: hypothetical protein ABR575_10410 [Actinomycetota bacterium]